MQIIKFCANILQISLRFLSWISIIRQHSIHCPLKSFHPQVKILCFSKNEWLYIYLHIFRHSDGGSGCLGYPSKRYTEDGYELRKKKNRLEDLKEGV